jgi:hypothetical protein
MAGEAAHVATEARARIGRIEMSRDSALASSAGKTTGRQHVYVALALLGLYVKYEPLIISEQAVLALDQVANESANVDRRIKSSLQCRRDLSFSDACNDPIPDDRCRVQCSSPSYVSARRIGQQWLGKCHDGLRYLGEVCTEAHEEWCRSALGSLGSLALFASSPCLPFKSLLACACIGHGECVPDRYDIRVAALLNELLPADEALLRLNGQS